MHTITNCLGTRLWTAHPSKCARIAFITYQTCERVKHRRYFAFGSSLLTSTQPRQICAGGSVGAIPAYTSLRANMTNITQFCRAWPHVFRPHSSEHQEGPVRELSSAATAPRSVCETVICITTHIERFTEYTVDTRPSMTCRSAFLFQK